MNRIFASIVAAGCLLLAGTNHCHAQQFSFGITTGGGHHHGGCYHGGYWGGPYWGPPWYGPSYGVIYAPPPIIRERVVYVEPQRANPWTAPVNPSVSSAPSNSAGTASLASSATGYSRVTIHNASGAKLPVTFLLDGQDMELADGAAQSFAGAAHHTITYDRGGRFGSTQQDITPGDYDFRITPSGWDLVRKPDLPPASRTARANPLPER
jgi:hypothetical protein